MSTGINLPLSVFTDELWQNYDYGRLFLYILSKTDKNGMCSVTSTEVKTKLGISRQRFRNMLLKLKNNHQINHQTTNRTTTIAFDVQTVKCSKQPTNQPSNNHQKNQQESGKFRPPTREEAQSYIDEKGFHWGDADAFIDWYESIGWKVGNKPMKNWKAAMRTWENKWKHKYGNKTIEDKYSSRRGVDVGAHTEEDYGGAF